MKHTVMDHNGDSSQEFDVADPVGLAEAEAHFKKLTGSGFAAAAVEEGGKQSLIRSFDPNAEEILFIPALQGG